jgi:hypothetical protein
MSINEYIKKYRIITNYNSKDNTYNNDEARDDMVVSRNPHLICVDGFEMSVQAGHSLYSSPKDISDYYTEVEVGFPSEAEELLFDYAENRYENEPSYTDTVYPYVPVEVVDNIINKHGGIKGPKNHDRV